MVTGKIIDAATGGPLAGICVNAHGSGGFLTSPPSDSSGVYTLGGLTIDSYELFATDCTNSPAAYSPVDYKNIKGLDRNVAKFITFKKDGALKKKINFTMPRAGHIDVLVLDCASQVPITNVEIVPYGAQLDKKGLQFQSGFANFTDINGMITLDVTTGGSKVAAFTPNGGGGYTFQKYYVDDKDFGDFAGATVVNTSAGAFTPITIILNDPCM
jgi:hypothetical protein